VSEASYDGVTLARHGAVCELILDRPESHNAISTAMARSIAAACTAVAADSGVRSVVLSARGDRAFCVGADLKERATFDDDDLQEQRPVFRAAFGAVLALPQPSVAAVQGFALGGGTELALACDLIVAQESAVFGLPEVTVGLVPGGGGTQLLARRIGYGKAADLIFTGRPVAAAEAFALGIVDRLVPSDARTAAVEVATLIAANSPVGIRAAKRALREGGDTSLADGLELEDAAWREAAFSADRREGIAAFNEKRQPRWPDPAPHG
jgi:enoyl-CoA hydratase/carnithine racemase